MKEGQLFRNDINERWNVVFAVKPEPDYDVMTSGSFLEVKIGKKWIPTTIEHNGKDYYATTQGLALSNGLRARVHK